jgi:hypothetical protein
MCLRDEDLCAAPFIPTDQREFSSKLCKESPKSLIPSSVKLGETQNFQVMAGNCGNSCFHMKPRDVEMTKDL